MNTNLIRLEIFVDKESSERKIYLGVTDKTSDDLYEFERTRYLRLQFSTKSLWLARHTAAQLASRIGFDFEDLGELEVAHRYTSPSNVLSCSAAAHLRLFQALYDHMDRQTGKEPSMAFHKVAEQLEGADDEAGHKILSDWVFENSFRISAMKKAFKDTTYEADIIALEALGLGFSHRFEDARGAATRLERIATYNELQHELQRRRKNPTARATSAHIRLDRINRRLNGPAWASGSTAFRGR